MKKLKLYLLPLLTLLLIAVGGFMPYAAAYLQDRQTERATSSQQFTPVSLNLRQDTIVGPVWQLLNQNDSNWLDYEGSTNLNGDEIIKITREYVADLAARGLIINNIEYFDKTDLAIEHCLVANESYSAIIWLCSWSNSQDNNFYQVLIDDLSGKVIRQYLASPYLNIEPMNNGLLFISTSSLDRLGDTFMIVSNSLQKIGIADTNDIDSTETDQIIVERSVIENSDNEIDNYDEDNFPLLVKWRSFCEEYYNIKINDVEKIYSEDSISYQLKFQQDGQEYMLPITIFANQTFFL